MQVRAGPGGQLLATRAANKVRDHVISLYITKGGANDPNAATRWLALHHYKYWVAYQPADHFWILQAVVGLVVLAIAVLCSHVAVRCIRGRRA